jgi:hypothetical protein
MRRYPITILILLLSTLTVFIIYKQYWSQATKSLTDVDRVRNAPSEIYARMLVRYAKPPIYDEEWSMQDVEGTSTYQYRIRSYEGKQITITQPKGEMFDVSFFFGRLDQDGVWQIVDKPDRGDTNVRYTIYVKQLADYKQGERTVIFTDPHYWATAAGRQYNIDLSKTNPNDLLKLQSTQLADPRYQAIVEDFRNFGPDSFRRKIETARAQLGAK